MLDEKNHITLVNSKDEFIGVGEKMKVHEQGVLHRAFSIFVLRQKNQGLEILLQKRNKNKYHSGGLWTNSCCGHPFPEANLITSATKRLFEEFGFSLSLQKRGVFEYRAYLDHGLIEHEIDHVLIGYWNGELINPNQEEIEDFTWIRMENLKDTVKKNSEQFTSWFPQALQLLNF